MRLMPERQLEWGSGVGRVFIPVQCSWRTLWPEAVLQTAWPGCIACWPPGLFTLSGVPWAFLMTMKCSRDYPQFINDDDDY